MIFKKVGCITDSRREMDDDSDDSIERSAKRPKSFQDDVIQRTIAEEEAEKRARKAQKESGAPQSKGKTLQEIEVRKDLYVDQICLTHAMVVVLLSSCYEPQTVLHFLKEIERSCPHHWVLPCP
jgi:hypothetical protein